MAMDPTIGIPRELFPGIQADRFEADAARRTAEIDWTAFSRYADTQVAGLETRRRAWLPVQEPVQEEGPGIGDIPFVGGILTGAGTFLSGAIDAINRPASAISGAVLGAQGDERAGGSALTGFATGLFGSSEQRADFNFASVLENLHVENEWARNITGFGLDVLTDPLNLLSLGPARRALQAGYSAATRGAEKVPVLGRFIDSLAPRFGRTNLNAVRRDIGDEGANLLMRHVRRIRALDRSGDAQAVREVAKAIGHTTDEEATAGMDLLLTYHGQPWDKPRDLAKTIGQRDVINFFESEFDSVEGKTAKLLGEYVEGFMPTKGTYGHAIFFDESTKAIYSRARRTNLTRQNTTKSIARERSAGEQLRDRSLIRDARVVAAMDISHVRRLAARNAMLSDETLTAFKGRKQYLDAAEIKLVGAELRNNGISTDMLLKARQDGVPVEQLIENLGVFPIGSRGVKSELVAKRLLEGIGITEERQLTTRDLLKSWFDNTAGKDEGVLLPNEVRTTYLTPLEIDDTWGRVLNGPRKEVEEAWIVPESVKESLEQITEPATMQGILTMVDTVNSLWKPLVTVAFPAFHVRNGYSNILMNFQAGMFNPLWYADAAKAQKGAPRISVKLSEKGKSYLAEQGLPVPKSGVLDYTNDDLNRELMQLQAMDTGTSALVPREELVYNKFTRPIAKVLGRELPPSMNEKLNSLERVKAMFGEYGKTLTQQNSVLGLDVPTPLDIFRWGSTLNQSVDNNAKLAHILWRLSDGHTLENAVDLMRTALPDYLEFGYSPTFRQIRTAFPFASWLRFSIPRQLELLATQPYVASKLGLLGDPAATVDERLKADVAMLPDWVLERHNVIFGKNDDGSLKMLYGLGLPLEDLNQLFATFTGRGKQPGLEGAVGGLEGTLNNILEDTGPLLRGILELGLQHSFFTGEPIDDPRLSNYYRRAWGWSENIPGLRDWLEIEKRQTKTGELIVANPVKMYILASLFGRIGNTAGKVGEFAQDRDGMVAVSLLSGFKVGDVFPKPPEDLPFSSAIAQNPALNDLYTQYQGIPLYDNLDAETGNRAARAMRDVMSRALLLRSWNPGLSKPESEQMAAQELSALDPEVNLLYEIVRKQGLKQTGRRARQQFLAQYPELRSAFAELPEAVSAQVREDALAAG